MKEASFRFGWLELCGNLSRRNDDCDCHAIMSFFADGLNHGSSHARFVCEKLIEAADTLDT
jgi:hypothetical protein